MRRRADGAEASLLFGPGNRRKGSPPALRSCRADDRFRRNLVLEARSGEGLLSVGLQTA